MSNTIGGYSLPHEHKARRPKRRARWIEREQRFKELTESLPPLDPSGRWIMLTVKLPTRPSPPKLAIFWSVPWPDMARFKMQSLREQGDEDFEIDARVFYSLFGKEPNWRLARKIVYQGNEIRVFAHEFSFVTLANFRAFVFGHSGEAPSHDFTPGDVAGERLLDNALEGDDRFIRDAALVDGCTPEQALAVAMGQDITDEEMEFPPLGWYKCRPEYGLIFCEPGELEETGIEPINLDNQEQGEQA